MAVTWRVKAIEDVGKIVRYIARDSPVAARQMGKDLLWAGDSLELFPDRGRAGRVPGTRELVITAAYSSSIA